MTVTTGHRIFALPFASVYPLYVEKVERKGRSRAELDTVITWLTGYEEAMAYGMPGYSRAGAIEVSFASQKGYIALYVTKKPVVDAHRDQLAGLNVGKGCIRFRRPEQLDFAVIRSLLEGTRDTDAPICE